MKMPKPNGILEWNLSKLSTELKLSEIDTRNYFTDGRRVSFLLERRLAFEVIKGKLSQSEGAGYDLIDSKGKKWEVRSISKGGIYFCPSYMVGSGRKFSEGGFLDKLNEIEGYIISDIEKFPKIPYWIIPSSIIHSWYKSKKLGSGTKLTQSAILKILSSPQLI